MIKYLGSKHLLIPHILDTIKSLPDVTTVMDLFSGTGRVAFALKQAGYAVRTNDINDYPYVSAVAHLSDGPRPDIQELITWLNNLVPYYGYVTDTFCIKSRFFTVMNGMKIDAARLWVERHVTRLEDMCIALTSICEAADKVDSTVGLQMAYLKTYAARAHNPIVFKYPDICVGPSVHCIQADARDIREPCDVYYMDPPYNQHNYASNYHIWETIVKNDRPTPNGVACRRPVSKSVFNSKRGAFDELKHVIGNAPCRYVVLSYSSEGFIGYDELVAFLNTVGPTTVRAVTHGRYIGHDIGRHNLEGDRVSESTRSKNVEYIFITEKK